MKTETLIESLTLNVDPVKPLRSPSIRTLCWFAISLPYCAVILWMMSPRPDLALKLMDARYLIEQGAALLTAVAASFVAFRLTIPGETRLLILPIVPLAVWLGSLFQGFLQEWFRTGIASISLQNDWICLPAIVLAGAIPALSMVVMLRRGAPLAPRITVALGGLAAGALGNFGLRFFHQQDVSLMVLVWQFGTVALMSALCGLIGRRILRWPHLAHQSE